MATYTVHLVKPKMITLHYTHHDITTDHKPAEFILHDVDQNEMDELFRSGIVLRATKNLPDEKEKEK